MQLVSSRDMQVIEAAADAGGLSYAQMMQNAGRAVAFAADDWMGGNPGVIVILCGPGNNGGDGLVAAARLAEMGHAVRVLCWKRPAKDPLLAAAQRPEIGIVRGEARDSLAQLDAWLEGADLLVDALLGTGVSRPIRGQLAEILDLAAAAVDGPDGPAVIAVDLPTGLHADDGAVDPRTIAADVTVTFGFPKVGLFTWPGAAYVGHLIIDDIGIPAELADLAEAELRMATEDEVLAALPQLRLDAHKGSFGRALLLAGSERYPGAALLAAEAAARAGCGLVEVAAPSRLVPGLAGSLREATWLPLAEPAEDGSAEDLLPPALLERLAEAEAVLVGPGLSRSPVAAARFEALLEATATAAPGTWVVDADGLNLLAAEADGPSRLPSRSVLTPHPGEMARLLDMEIAAVNADRVGVARRAATRWGHLVVLKGALTVIAEPDGRATVMPFANPALATAGTGDVLAGLLVGLLAQGLPPSDAARVAAWIHGRAGELAAEDLGMRGTLAGDVLDRVPEAMRELEEDWPARERVRRGRR